MLQIVLGFVVVGDGLLDDVLVLKGGGVQADGGRVIQIDVAQLHQVFLVGGVGEGEHFVVVLGALLGGVGVHGGVQGGGHLGGLHGGQLLLDLGGVLGLKLLLGHLGEQIGKLLVAHGGDVVLHLALVQAGLAGECLLQGGLNLLPAHGAGGLPHRLVDLLLGGQALDGQVRLRLALLLQAGHIAAESTVLLLVGEVAGALLEG